MLLQQTTFKPLRIEWRCCQCGADNLTNPNTCQYCGHTRCAKCTVYGKK